MRPTYPPFVRAGWHERASLAHGKAVSFDFARYAATVAAWDVPTLFARLDDLHAGLDEADRADRLDYGSRGGRLRDECSALRAEINVRARLGPDGMWTATAHD